MRKLFFLIVLGVLGSCKDNCPDPNGTGSNGTGNTGGTGTEYTIKGKLLNGTTMEPINPGMEMTLIAQNNGLAVKREELGTCRIEEDGSFELKYLYSEVAAISTAFMRFESQFYISEYLPRNQSLDTILYESSFGGGVIKLIDLAPNNSIYWAYSNINDSMIFGQLLANTTVYHDFRQKTGQFRVFYDSVPLNYDRDRNRILGTPPSKSLTVSGDPFSDTLVIEH